MSASSVIDLDRLDGAPETLLIMVSAKARESLRPDGILRDEKVLELWDGISQDVQHLNAGGFTQLGVCVRTVMFDERVQMFLEAHPWATVVNLGAGLDTRFWRLDNGKLQWFDLDLPEPLELRRRCFPETDRMRSIAGSAIDPLWMSQIGEPEHLLVVMEGLSMFLSQEEMQGLLSGIADRFPGSEMVFDAMSPKMVKHAARFESFRKTNGVWVWGIESSRTVTDWDPRIELLFDASIFDRYPRRWGLAGWFMRLPRMRRLYRPHVMHVRFR